MGPASDVYSLGAPLSTFVTGLTTFQDQRIDQSWSC